MQINNSSKFDGYSAGLAENSCLFLLNSQNEQILRAAANRLFELADKIAANNVSAAETAAVLTKELQQMSLVQSSLAMVSSQGRWQALDLLIEALTKLIEQPELVDSSNVETAAFGALLVESLLNLQQRNQEISAGALFGCYQKLKTLARQEKSHPVELWQANLAWQNIAIELKNAPSFSADQQQKDAVRLHFSRLLTKQELLAAWRLRAVAMSLSVQAAANKKLHSFWLLVAAFFEAIAYGQLALDEYVKQTLLQLYLYLNHKDDKQPDSHLVNQVLTFIFATLPSNKTKLYNEVRLSLDVRTIASFDYRRNVDEILIKSNLEQWYASINKLHLLWSLHLTNELFDSNEIVQASKVFFNKLLTMAPTWRPVVDEFNLLFAHCIAKKSISQQDQELYTVSLLLEYLENFCYRSLFLLSKTLGDVEKFGRIFKESNRTRNYLPLQRLIAADYIVANENNMLEQLLTAMNDSITAIEQRIELLDEDNIDQVAKDVFAALDNIKAGFVLLEIYAVVSFFQQIENSFLDYFAVSKEQRAEAAALASLCIANLAEIAAIVYKISAYPSQQLRYINEVVRYKDGALSYATTAVKKKSKNKRKHAKAVKAEDFYAIEFDWDEPVEMQRSLVDSAAINAVALSSTEIVENNTPVEGDFAELLDIFEQEAIAVIDGAVATLTSLSNNHADVDSRLLLRRCYHTLKGSARMLGFNRFGEAAWSMEQLLNRYNEHSLAVDVGFLQFNRQALAELSQWVKAELNQAIEAGKMAIFQQAFQIWQTENRFMDLSLAVAALNAGIEVTDVPELVDVAEDLTGTTDQPKAAEQSLEQPSAAVTELVNTGIGEAEETLIDELIDEMSSAESRQLIHTIGYLVLTDRESQQFQQDSAAALAAIQQVLLATAAVDRDKAVATLLASTAALVVASQKINWEELQDFAAQLNKICAFLLNDDNNYDFALEFLTKAVAEIEQICQQFAAGTLLAPAEALFVQANELQQLFVKQSAGLQVALINAAAAATDEALEQEIDPELFPIFAEEAAELFPKISKNLRLWLSSPSDSQAHSLTLRALHTLKGSSRLTGAVRIGARVHSLESTLKDIQHKVLDEEQKEQILEQLDLIQAQYEQLKLADEQSFGMVASSSVAAIMSQLSSSAAAATTQLQAGAASASMPLDAAAIAASSIRLSTEVLEEIAQHSSDVAMLNAQLSEKLHSTKAVVSGAEFSVTRLDDLMRRIELSVEERISARLEPSLGKKADFDPLELDRFTETQELTRMIAESVDDIKSLYSGLRGSIRNLEDDLISQRRGLRVLQQNLVDTRMVSFDAIAELLHKLVRKTARELGKRVRLEIVGAGTHLDRMILEKMTPVFEHLIRNSVHHGIEQPETRLVLGKDEVGKIRIELQQRSNNILISVEDDGAGLNLAKIQAKAIEAGLIAADKVLTDEEIMQLIFQQGLSTVDDITAVAGRGVGMDVVRSEISSLGGRVEVITRAGEGCIMDMQIPATIGSLPVVIVKAAGQVLAIPQAQVTEIYRLAKKDFYLGWQKKNLVRKERKHQVYTMAELLGRAVDFAADAATSEELIKVMQLSSLGQDIILHVDEVIGFKEVVLYKTSAQLNSAVGLAGATLHTAGELMLIYDPAALATIQTNLAAKASAASSQTEHQVGLAPLILVVDDSVTVRRVTERLLKKEGFRVALATDGLHALELLQQECPAVILSDIEMPRMDGFDLVRSLRQNPYYAALPVVMITSRVAEKHRTLAQQLGVNHYLGKPYAEEYLLQLLAEYCSPNALL